MFDQLLDACEGLLEADPASFADGDTQVRLQQVRGIIDAITARAAAAFDTSQAWASVGARNAAAWLTIETRIPRREARRRVRLGHALADMPLVAAALAAGEIDLGHVEVLANARTEATAKAFERDEEMLLGFAKELSYRHFADAVRYWHDEADPDGAEERERKKHERRKLHLSQTFDGTWALDGTLAPIPGTILANELSRLEEVLFARDWNEAKARLGRDPAVIDLTRSHAQRRADALVEMATRSATAPKGGKRPAPLFTVVVGEDRLRRMCEMKNRLIVTEGSLLPYIDEAMIERILFRDGGKHVDVRKKQRLYSKKQRAAIEVVYPECAHPYCEEPAERCQMDHIEPAAKGGETVFANGRSLCAYHNRLRNKQRDEDA